MWKPVSNPCEVYVKNMCEGVDIVSHPFHIYSLCKISHAREICMWNACEKSVKITNILMRRWNHNVILIRCISRFLLAVCRRWFPGLSGDWTCLVLYKRLVICFARPFQLLPSACTDIPFTLSWKFFPPPPQSPTCHRLHLLIVLSSLVCRKYLLICGGFLSPPFLKRC